MSFTIAPTRREDIPALQAVERAAAEMFRGTGLISFPASVTGRTFHEARIATSLSFTALHGAEPVGFVLGTMQPPDIYIDELSVDPAHGRRGIGRALVDRLCVAAAEQGCRAAVLSTFREPLWNAPFYAKIGFTEIAEADFDSWMATEHARQAEYLDVTKRCFMRRPTA